MNAHSTISSREFNQDVSRAKRAADEGPVIITDRGKPAYVLLRHSDYEAMTQPGKNLLDLLYSPAAAALDVEFESLKLGLKPAQFD